MTEVTEYDPKWRVTLGAGTEMGIGIVGCGGIVQYAHLPAYKAAGLDVQAVYDIDRDKAREVASKWGIPSVAGSVEALAGHPDVQIVDIAVPPWVQPEIVATAAAAGKHMLCQKPLALDLDAARGIVQTAEAAGVIAAVNQQMRWDAGIAASRDLIDSGAIGQVTRAEIQVSVATPWHLWPWLAAAPRLEVLYHSLHYLDALRSILGDPAWVTSVHGRDPNQDPVRGETKTLTVLEFTDSLHALVAVDHYNTHGTPYAVFRFLGTEGAIEGTIGLMYDYPDGRPDTLQLQRADTDPVSFELDEMWIPDAFAGPMGELMDAVSTGRDPSHSVEDNLITIAVAMACYESAEDRRSVNVSTLLAGSA